MRLSYLSRAVLAIILLAVGSPVAHAQDAASPLHENGEYLVIEVDLTEQLSGEEREEIVLANAQLAALHAERGFDIHVILTDSTEAAPVVDIATQRLRASHADAVILVDGERETIGIAGLNIDSDEGARIADFMAQHFDKGEMRSGMAYGIRATAQAMTP